MSTHDPLSPGARIELERLARRWQQLPLDQALSRVHMLRELAQRFADQSADIEGRPPQVLPDLGPATSLDQLVVTAYDLAGTQERRRSSEDADDIESALADLRRAL